MEKTAVIGAGIMGRGIALVYALHGWSVALHDTSEEALEQAKSLIGTDLMLLADEGLISAAECQATLDNITPTTSLKEAVGDAGFITEAVPEQLALKWQIFSRIEAHAPATAIIASNTSTLPLSELSRQLAKPERMLITHFFNPAHLVPLVEIVRAENTPDETLTTLLNVLRQAGKIPVVLKKEVPGFIANRLQAAILREALHLVESGVASEQDIDQAVTAGPGFRWSVIGPLETADFGGLDTWQSVMKNLAPELDCTPTTPAVLKEMNRRGQLGVKTGQGFYSYPDRQTIAGKIHFRNLAFIRLLKQHRKE
ncbi:3-hydroxybutyryl-CoA dehydrogenase [Geothermobacter hydrogeniphilus]|uniref:L-gulonate 3-dehydrogenase n=1 Tax=Geothermobacter hydrogeniphilus TaxID=1969733 RepID=A0A2K2HAF1_9BACT|nr:3-hydroxyacyl-CoA dehydrogenase family protein [Geothermobacter hydrogeniphilus]PNU20203.1 3-hydroxybutyryl-CoA dehydrogenase [Geothermobacter hydrogeniphilus]